MVVTKVLRLTFAGGLWLALAAGGCGGNDASTAQKNTRSDQPKVTMGGKVKETPTAAAPKPGQGPLASASQAELPPKQPPSSEVKPTGPSTKPPAAEPMPPAGTPISTQAESKVATFAGFKAPKPVTWQWQPVPDDKIRVAQYVVPGRDGADQGRITISWAMGSLDSQIARWIGQFRVVDGQTVEPKLETTEAAGMKVTLVEIAGDYAGMAGSYALDQLFITAIVPTEPQQLYIKFVGPRATVEANRADFLAMVKGLEETEPEK